MADVTIAADALVALGVDCVLALRVTVIAAGQQSGCRWPASSTAQAADVRDSGDCTSSLCEAVAAAEEQS